VGQQDKRHLVQVAGLTFSPPPLHKATLNINQHHQNNQNAAYHRTSPIWVRPSRQL